MTTANRQRRGGGLRAGPQEAACRLVGEKDKGQAANKQQQEGWAPDDRRGAGQAEGGVTGG